jgi:hypothetical protein
MCCGVVCFKIVLVVSDSFQLPKLEVSSFKNDFLEKFT